MTSIIWFRDDLRVADNPALRAAVEPDPRIADQIPSTKGAL